MSDTAAAALLGDAPGLELLEHQFSDVMAGDFTTIALLQDQFQIIHDRFEPFRSQSCFFARTTKSVKKLAATECFPVSIPFDHSDWNGFYSFVGREPEFTVQAFPASTHTATAISCS